MTGKTFIPNIREKAKKKRIPVAFPDAEDVRTLKAARTLKDQKIAEPWLVGNTDAILKVARDNGISLDGIPVVNPLTDGNKDKLVQLLFEKRKAKGWTLEQSAEAAKSPLYYAGLLLAAGKVGADRKSVV
jgi:phosphotransacetylase